MLTAKVKIVRERYTARSTTGKLFINGKFICYTLEDTVRPAGIKATILSWNKKGILINATKKNKMTPIIIL